MTRNSFCLWATILVATLARAEVIKVRILARVAGRTVSNRELMIENYLRKPEAYKVGKKDTLSTTDEQRVLQRLVTEIMIEEENRVVGSEKVPTATLEKEFNRIKTAFGKSWKDFQKEWGLSDHEIKERLHRSQLVDQVLASRVQNTPDFSGKKNPQEHATQVIEEWMKQLRSRYRVQLMVNGT